jgi:hypothetical protein
MKLLSLCRCVASLLICSCFSALLSAGTMLSPTAVLGTDLGTFDSSVPLENMINQSGLDKPFTSGVTDFDEYFTTGAPAFGQGNFANNWQSDFTFNLPLTGFVDFDLGAVYPIERIAIWNRSLENIEIQVSENLGDPMTSAGNFVLTNHLNFPFSYVPEILELNGTFDARYLRIDISSAYEFDVADDFAYAIVGELVVETLPSTPIFTADFDFDGDVDGDDLDDWQDAYGASALADADMDGDSDGADFLAWQRQFGSSVNPLAAISAVPEPTNAMLTAALVFFQLSVRRRLSS